MRRDRVATKPTTMSPPIRPAWCPAHYFRCTAAWERFGPADRPPCAPIVTGLGIAYLGLIVWHPVSQYTPPAADAGAGIGEFTAISRSASNCRSTPAISFSFSASDSHFFLFI